MMKKIAYRNLDCSVESFQFIKAESEKYWKTIELENCFGFQIQKGSTWKDGLSEVELEDFQQQLNLKFPASLNNFYRTMNGLSLAGINNNANEAPIQYSSTFYSYPEDINRIKEQINWVLEENKVTAEMLKCEQIPSIFPFLGHRFLILDEEELVLSMYGDDIVFWAENLAKAVAKDIFSIENLATSNKMNKNSFWNKKIR